MQAFKLLNKTIVSKNKLILLELEMYLKNDSLKYQKLCIIVFTIYLYFLNQTFKNFPHEMHFGKVARRGFQN